MKTTGIKRAIVMLLALAMLITSSGLTVFAESMTETPDNAVNEAVITELGSDAIQEAAEQAEAAAAEAVLTEDAEQDAVVEDQAVTEAEAEEAVEPEDPEDPEEPAEEQITAEDWEAGLPDSISDDLREAMAQVAKSQLDSEGKLYKAFANAESLDNWDASFVMFVLEYANVLGVSKAIGDESEGTVDKDEISVPVNADTDKWIKALKDEGLFTEISEEAAPEQGDIVFVKNGGDTEAAVVLDADENEITVIGAYINNVGKYVADTDKALGFVSIKDVAPEEFADEEQAEEPAEEAAEAADDADKEDAEELTEEELAAKKAEEEAAAKAAEEAAKAEEAGLTDQTLTAELISAPGFGGKLRGLFTSNKGTEIILSGYMPKDAVAKAYPVNVEIPGQSVLAAYDITIYVTDEDGKEVVWQPETALSVSIKDKAIPESADELSVFHMENKKAEPEQIGTVSAAAKSVEFEADSFSIYVVTQDADTVTYRFVENTQKDGDTWTGEYTQLRQILENGDKLVEPTAPTKEGSLFTGWYEYDLESGITSTTAYTDSDWTTVTVQQHEEGEDPISEEKILVAGFTDAKVKVTYYDQNESIVQIQEVVTGTTITPNDKTGANYVDYLPIQNEEGSYIVFQHWTDRPYGDKRKVEELTANTDISLYPVLGKAHYIHFNNNNSTIGGVNTSYTGSIVALPDEKPVEISDDAETVEPGQYKPGSIVPTASGYVFDGWYIKSDTSSTDKVFDANGHLVNAGWNKLMTKNGEEGLTYDPTLYAHWTPANATYSVVYYTLKADAGSGRDPENDYEFYKDMGTRQAATGSTVTRGSQDTVDNAFTSADDRAGFELSTVNNPTITVSGDGSSTLAVYFDRKVFELEFYYYRTANQSDAYLRRNGTLRKKITGLYGENISTNFPIDPNNKATRWSDNDHSTYQYVFAAMNLMPARNDVFQTTQQAAGNGSYQNVYYLQVTNNDADLAKATTDKENYKKTYTVNYYDSTRSRSITLYEYVLGQDGNVYHLEREMRHTFNYITLGEEFYEIFGFGRNTVDTEPEFGYNGYEDRACSNTGTNQGLYKLFYTRNEQTIHLVDTLNNRSDDAIFLYDELITEGDSRIAKFSALENNEQIDEDHYWFYDRACTDPVDFSNLKMPNHEMTFYAGLRKVDLIKLYPDGGEMLYGSGKSGNTYATWYRLYDGESITPYEDVRRDYIAVDSAESDTETFWYEEHYYQPGDENKPKDQIQRFTVYRNMDSDHENAQKYVYSPGAYSFVGWFKVPNGQDPASYEIPSGETPYDFSTEVHENLTLKAKWRLMGQFNIVYDAGEGVHAPVDSNTYQQGANAIVKASRGKLVGKQFRGWVVKGTTEPIYQPNGELLVSEDKAEVGGDGTMTITLEAVYDDDEYKDNYTADYIFKVGSTEYYRQTLSPGEELVTPAEPEVPTGAPEGAVFTGWYEDSACTQKFNGFGTVSSPVETILYAGFAKQHTVTYYDSVKEGDEWVKGNNIIQIQKYDDGAELDTSRVEYEIDSNRYVNLWNVQNGTQHAVGYKTSHTGYNVTSDLTLWPEMHDYTMLSFDSRGGSYVEPARVPAETGRWPNRPTEPTRPGFQFAGWFVTDTLITDESGNVVRTGEYNFDKPLSQLDGFNGHTLYAWWIPQGNTNMKAEYTIAFWAETSDGNGYEFQKVEKATGRIGSTITADNITSATTAEGTRIDVTSKDHLTGVNADVRKYFEYAGIEDSVVVVEDGSTVVNVRFNRTRYIVRFNTVGFGNDNTNNQNSNYGKVVYGGNEYYTGGTLYEFTTWYGQDVMQTWPVAGESRNGTTLAKIVPNKVGTLKDGRSWALNKAGTGQSQNGRQYGNLVSMNDAILKYAITDANNNKVVNLYMNAENIIGTVKQHYFLEEGEATELTTELIGFNANTVNDTDEDNNKYSSTYSKKTIKGYDIVDKKVDAVAKDQNNKLGYNIADSSRRTLGRLVKLEGAHTVQERYTAYSYGPNPNGTGRKYYIDLGGLTGDFRLLHAEFNNSSELQNSYVIKDQNGNTITNKPNVYYVPDGSNPVRVGPLDGVLDNVVRISWDGFIDDTIKESTTIKTRDVEETETVYHISFFYKRHEYKVNLFYDAGTPYAAKPSVNVLYNEYVPRKLEEASIPEPQAPAEGMVFDCWSQSPNARIEYDGNMPDYDMNLYACWKPIEVTVTTAGYDRQGNKVDSDYAVYSKPYGTLFRGFDISDPKTDVPGVTFKGWAIQGTEDIIPLGTNITEDTIVEPVWVDHHSGSPIYDLNGGALDDGKTKITGTVAVEGKDDQFKDSGSYLLGTSAMILSGNEIKNVDSDGTEYRFVCWNTKADGSGVDYYPGDMLKLSEESIVLYARYVEKRKVTLVYDLNTTDTNAKFYDLGTNNKYAVAANQTKEYLLIDSGDSNAAAGKINKVYEAGKEINDSKAANALVKFLPARPGYTFKGWSKTDGDNNSVDVKDGASIRVNTLHNENVETLYAVWEEQRLPIEVYEDSTIKNSGKDGYHLTTATTDASTPDSVEQAYRTQLGDDAYTISYGYEYENAKVGTDEIDQLQYVFIDTTASYEWQYHEKDADEDEFTPVGVGPVKVTFTNGELTVTKTVTGDFADTTKEFEFTLTAVQDAPENATFKLVKGTGNPVNIAVGGTFKLKNGESAKIKLPRGKNITITETAVNGYSAAFTCGTGTEAVPSTANAQTLKLTASKGTLEVTNTAATGDLTVSKTVSNTVGEKITGLPVDENQEYTFKLESVEGVADGTEFTFKMGDDESTIQVGDEFTLKHSESAVITLPQYKDVVITETPVDGYTPAFTCGTGTQEATGANATVTNGKKFQVIDDSAALDVTNTLATCDLTVTKTVLGGFADKNKPFTFKLEAVDGANENTKFRITNGSAMRQISVGGTFTLRHGETQTISLPQYKDVTITEVPDGYDPAFAPGTTGITDGGAVSIEEDGAVVRVGRKVKLTAATADLGVVNKLESGVLTISKTVKGQYGDQTRPFVFTLVSVEGAADGATFDIDRSTTDTTTPADKIAVGGTFTLQHDEEAKITLPRGKEIKIVEEQVSGYTATFEPGENTTDVGPVTEGEGDAAVTVGYKVKLAANEGALDVENEYTKAVVPTGIAKSNTILIPLFLGLILALGVVLSIIYRRRMESRTR